MLKRAHELLVGDVVMTSVSVLIVLQFSDSARSGLKETAPPSQVSSSWYLKVLEVLLIGKKSTARVIDESFWSDRTYDVLETVQVL